MGLNKRRRGMAMIPSSAKELFSRRAAFILQPPDIGKKKI
jgi:hypothetical protein